MHIGHQASRVLQPRHVDVAEHAVDAFDLKDHMLSQDIGHRSRYGHDGLRTEMGRPVSQPTVMTVHTPCRPAGHGLHPPTRAPKTTVTSGMPRRAGAKPRLDMVSELYEYCCAILALKQRMFG